MQKRGLAIGAAAMIGVTALTIISVIGANKLHKKEPFSEPPAAYSTAYQENKEGILFIPQYNEAQPNVLLTAPTKRTQSFVDAVKGQRSDVDWRDPLQAGGALCLEIKGMKKSISMPEAMERYLNRCKVKGRISADDFLIMPEVLCSERSVFLAACLRSLGFSPEIVLMEDKDKSGEMHMFVMAKNGSGFVFLDPTYGIAANSVDSFISQFKKISGKDCERVLYIAIPFSQPYWEYLTSDQNEAMLGKDMESKRKMP